MTHDERETTGRTVVGLFESRDRAEAALRALRDAGFPERSLGLAMRDHDTHAPTTEGAAAGALSGGVIGGLMGLLGSLLIPGLGPIVIGGVLASALTGAGVGAAAGGLVGALVSLGIPEADARHFDEGVRSGAVLVTVRAGRRTEAALALLRRHDVDPGPSARRGPDDRRRAADPAYRGPERRLVRT